MKYFQEIKGVICVEYNWVVNVLCGDNECTFFNGLGSKGTVNITCFNIAWGCNSFPSLNMRRA